MKQNTAAHVKLWQRAIINLLLLGSAFAKRPHCLSDNRLMAEIKRQLHEAEEREQGLRAKLEDQTDLLQAWRLRQEKCLDAYHPNQNGEQLYVCIKGARSEDFTVGEERMRTNARMERIMQRISKEAACSRAYHLHQDWDQFHACLHRAWDD